MKLNYRVHLLFKSNSVFAVIFYHANFFVLDHELFQGGFIGVDIFFVTRVLITSLTLKEIYNNSFSITFIQELEE